MELSYESIRTLEKGTGERKSVEISLSRNMEKKKPQKEHVFHLNRKNKVEQECNADQLSSI